MNQYPFLIGIVVALVMVCLTSNPMWWMIVVLGIGANGLVVAANGWKMPVRGLLEETVRHRAMTASTQYKWLADVIPTGLGKASIGDFLLAAGVMGAWATRDHFPYAKLMIVLGLAWWGSGWSKGFRLFEKWPAEARRDARKNIPIMLLLMAVANLVHVRGCSVGELRASAKDVESAIASPAEPKVSAKPQAKWRDLGVLAAPPPVILRRLREDTAKREREASKDAAIKAIVTSDTMHQLFGHRFIVTAKSARSGPFCRVTCSAHHGGEYDVETIPELCRADWIPPNAQNVPGWYSISDTHEFTNPWPGPAQQGFKSYKLYWSGVQSDAKVVHRSGIGVP